MEVFKFASDVCLVHVFTLTMALLETIFFCSNPMNSVFISISQQWESMVDIVIGAWSPA